MLEARVGRLEEKVDRIEAILIRLEPKITETLQTCAKNSEDLHKLQLDVIEIKTTAAKQEDLNRLQVEVAEVKGRLAGIEGCFTQVPTIWNMFALIVTLLIGMAGLMFTAGKYLHT